MGFRQILGFRQIMAILAGVSILTAAGFAMAQDAPSPAPLPAFRQPATDLVASQIAPPSSEQPAADGSPTTRTVTTTAITPNAAAEAIAAIPANPQPVQLIAEVTEGGGNLTAGLEWRIYDTKADANGQLTLAAKSDEAVANVELAPGNYVVHVSYGRAQTTDTLTVAEGRNSKTVVLEAGGLRLNAAVTGDVPIPINLLHFDVFTAGQSDADRELVAQNMGANDILMLSSGTYHVVSYFGSVNAVVRADLKVDPGQLTDVVLYHKAEQISFKLVSEAGGEAIADVDWTVKASDGTTVFTDIGAFPSTVLEEGDYVVFGKRGEQVFNRDFQVQAGQPREIEVLTAVY